jgi:hypothetical protein
MACLLVLCGSSVYVQKKSCCAFFPASLPLVSVTVVVDMVAIRALRKRMWDGNEEKKGFEILEGELR